MLVGVAGSPSQFSVPMGSRRNFFSSAPLQSLRKMNPESVHCQPFNP